MKAIWNCAQGLLSGLHATYLRNITHRDVSPRNRLITGRWQPPPSKGGPRLTRFSPQCSASGGRRQRSGLMSMRWSTGMPHLQSFVARAPSHFLKNGVTSVTMATLFWKRSWREDTAGSRSSRRAEFSSQRSPGAVQVSPRQEQVRCSRPQRWRDVRPHGRCHDQHGARWSEVLGHERCQKRHVRRVWHYHMRVQRRAAVLADALFLEPKNATGRNSSACVIFPPSGGVVPSPDAETSATSNSTSKPEHDLF